MLTQQQKESWFDFWSTNQSECIVGDNADRSNTRIKQNWEHELDEVLLDHKDEIEIYDLACGAGFLTNIVAGVVKELTASITAFDIASIDDSSFVEGINFVGGKTTEELVSWKGTADIVVSNFGFEYTDAKAGINSLLNLTQSGAFILLNSHCTDSAYYEDAKSIIVSWNQWNEKLNFLQFSNELINVDRQEQRVKKIKDYLAELAMIDKSTDFGISKMQLLEVLLPAVQELAVANVKEDKIRKLISSIDLYIERLKHQVMAAENLTEFLELISIPENELKLEKENLLKVDDKVISKFLVIKRL